MSLFFLDYDLRAPGRNYQPLYNELARIGAKRLLQSSWCFQIAGISAEALRDHFMRYIDQNDGLWVAEVTDWATYRTQMAPNALQTT